MHVPGVAREWLDHSPPRRTPQDLGLVILQCQTTHRI